MNLQYTQTSQVAPLQFAVKFLFYKIFPPITTYIQPCKLRFGSCCHCLSSSPQSTATCEVYVHLMKFSGMWEIPLVMWNDLRNGRCSMLDACSNPNNAEDVYKLLWQNFARHYNTNRAPIGLYYHAAWFTQPQNMEGFERFLDTILSLDDVWFVTGWQVIQWMRNLSNPVDPLNFEPFQCNNNHRVSKGHFL